MTLGAQDHTDSSKLKRNEALIAAAHHLRVAVPKEASQKVNLQLKLPKLSLKLESKLKRHQNKNERMLTTPKVNSNQRHTKVSMEDHRIARV